MKKDKVIEQLESLKDNSKSFMVGDSYDDIWANDIIALDYAIKKVKPKTYAIYKGDTFVDLGTVAYLSKKYGISEETIRFYASPVYRRRLEAKNIKNRKIVICIDN